MTPGARRAAALAASLAAACGSGGSESGGASPAAVVERKPKGPRPGRLQAREKATDSCPYYAFADPGSELISPRSAGVWERVADAGQSLFAAPVPAFVHQIWIGDPAAMPELQPRLWRSFCARFGYGYRLWSQNDRDDAVRLLPPDLLAWWDRTISERNFVGAADILRMGILAEMGGIYMDVDIFPPSEDGEMIDLRRLLPLRGLILGTEGGHAEKGSREIGKDSLFAFNGLVMTPPHNPIIEAMLPSLPPTLEKFTSTFNGYWSAAHSSGPFILNRLIEGPYTLFPTYFWRQFHLFDGGELGRESP